MHLIFLQCLANRGQGHPFKKKKSTLTEEDSGIVEEHARIKKYLLVNKIIKWKYYMHMQKHF